jgi:hypothetical protein
MMCRAGNCPVFLCGFLRENNIIWSMYFKAILKRCRKGVDSTDFDVGFFDGLFSAV